MRLKGDTPLRRRLFVPEAMQHPAKGHLGLWEAIIDQYTQPGEWILDPMAGIGGTLMGALMGRNVVAVELEEHFVQPMKASWAKMRAKPMLGCEMGCVVILRGDARALPLGRVDGIVTSPPYEGGGHHGGAFDTWGGVQEAIGWKGGYTRPVDAVVTSPPYQNREDGGGLIAEKGEGGFHPYTREPTVYWHTQRDQTNIGNLRGDRYWAAMEQVYGECHRVLKPQGVMVLVVKGFTRDKQYIDLPDQTREMVDGLGFSLIDRWERELWSLSFWRRLQQKRDPEAFDERLRYESVLAFRRGGAG